MFVDYSGMLIMAVLVLYGLFFLGLLFTSCFRLLCCNSPTSITDKLLEMDFDDYGEYDYSNDGNNIDVEIGLEGLKKMKTQDIG